MHETDHDLVWLQALLDRSYGQAGDHLRSITTPQRRISAVELSELLAGVSVLDLATVTTACEPRVAAVDGLFFRAHFYFGSSRRSVRYRHLRRRPQVSASYTRGEEISVVVHGTANLFSLTDGDAKEFRDYCYQVYIPRYGERWKDFATGADIFFARIDPKLMFTFRMDQAGLP